MGLLFLSRRHEDGSKNFARDSPYLGIPRHYCGQNSVVESFPIVVLQGTVCFNSTLRGLGEQ